MLVRADDKDIKRRKSYMERCFTIYEEKILWWFSVHLVKVSKSFQYKKRYSCYIKYLSLQLHAEKRYFH